MLDVCVCVTMTMTMSKSNIISQLKVNLYIAG